MNEICIESISEIAKNSSFSTSGMVGSRLDFSINSNCTDLCVEDI